ncbi:nucleoside triphosphate pyrophosphohydrolase [Candidatus Daviesbacteria bacterium]|nr:nucleoside triphosphate pyrophosphohydrolase [Candidatus Daviesbacteria bacterium]
MKYNKLVRDKIPEIIKADGQTPITHIANNEEYRKKLLEKLQEEVEEFLKEQNPEELADMLEVIDAICKLKNINPTKLQKIKQQKAIDRGEFKKRIILEEIIKNP